MELADGQGNDEAEAQKLRIATDALRNLARIVNGDTPGNSDRQRAGAEGAQVHGRRRMGERLDVLAFHNAPAKTRCKAYLEACDG